MSGGFKHEKIYASLREGIAAGRYAAGQKLPGQLELMASFGVSCATISAALKALVDEGLIVRRRGAGTFVADPADRSRLRRFGATSNARLGLLCSHTLSQPVGVLKGICEEIADSGVGLEFVVYHTHEEIPLVARRIVQREIKVDGCLVVTLQGAREAVAVFREHHFPYVITDSPCVYEGAHQIVMDHRHGARMAVDHLVRHGHQRIALLDVAGASPEADPWLHCKRAGYCDSLTAAGLPVDPELMVSSPSDQRSDVCRTVSELVERAEFSAIFVSMVTVAVEVMDGLREAGKRVPLDVAVTSFNVDQRPELSDDSYSVTGIVAPRIEAGRAAVEALSQIVAGRISASEPYAKDIPMKLIGQRSCGCAVAFEQVADAVMAPRDPHP